MMPVIRISDQTWERMKGHARPLEDTAEDIVVRALNALDRLEGKSTPKIKAKPRKIDQSRAEKTPQKYFRMPLLKALLELGGAGRAKDIRAILERDITSSLKNGDFELVTTGEPRWWNATCWERSELVKEGLLKADSERGIWELSEEGVQLADQG